jgi:hypothetical protein
MGPKLKQCRNSKLKRFHKYHDVLRMAMCRHPFHPSKLCLPGTRILWRNACVEYLFRALDHSGKLSSDRAIGRLEARIAKQVGNVNGAAAAILQAIKVMSARIGLMGIFAPLALLECIAIPGTASAWLSAFGTCGDGLSSRNEFSNRASVSRGTRMRLRNT